MDQKAKTRKRIKIVENQLDRVRATLPALSRPELWGWGKNEPGVKFWKWPGAAGGRGREVRGPHRGLHVGRPGCWAH